MRKAFQLTEEQALLKRIHSRLETVERNLRSTDFEQNQELLSSIHLSLAAWDKSESQRMRYELFSEVAMSLSRAIGLDDILTQIVDGLAKIIPFDAVAVLIVDHNEIAAEYLRGYLTDAYEKVHQKLGEGIVGRIVQTGRTECIPDVRKDPNYISARIGTRSELAVPMFSQATGEVIGVFNLESNNLNAYDNDDADLVATLASNAAVAIERAQMYHQVLHQQRINEELAVARRIQQSLLPADDELYGLEMKGYSYPSELVGGDYYDFFPLTDKDVGIVIADVAGKGVPAALIMAGLRGSLRVEARNTYAIGQIIDHINRFLHSTSRPGEFVTLFYGVIDCNKQILTYTNAGHNPGILFRSNGEVELLSRGGVPVGAFPEGEWEETRIEFNPGDHLLLYTDGVTEAESNSQGMFGIKRLVDTVKELQGPNAQTVIDTVRRAAATHLNGKEFSDDMTLLSIVYGQEGSNG